MSLKIVRINTIVKHFLCSKIKTLGDSDSDEDAATWVRRNRMKQREKEKADKTVRTSKFLNLWVPKTLS